MRAPDTPTVKVLLLGGPNHLPPTLTVDASQLASDRLKIPTRGGYEHFVRDDDAERSQAVGAVYFWYARTEIAE